MADYVPRPDIGFNTWVDIATVFIVANQAILGVSIAQVNEMGTLHTAWGVAWADHLAAVITARGALEVKEESRDALESYMRFLIKIIQANEGTTDQMRESMQITIPDTTPTPQSEDIVLETEPPMLLISLEQRSQARVSWGLNPANERANPKPQGIQGCNIQFCLGGIPEDPSAWELLADDTNSPYIHQLHDTAPQKIGYRARWFDRRMRKGPWGQPEEATISA